MNVEPHHPQNQLILNTQTLMSMIWTQEFIVTADTSLTERHLRVSIHSEVEHRHRPRHHQPQTLQMNHTTQTQ